MPEYGWINNDFMAKTLPQWQTDLNQMFDTMCTDISGRTDVIIPEELKQFCRGLFRQSTFFKPDTWVTHKDESQVINIIEIVLRRSLARAEIYERGGKMEYSIIGFAKEMLSIPCFLNPPAHPKSG